MNLLGKAFTRQVLAIRNNLLVALLVLITAAADIYWGYLNGKPGKAIAFLVTMWVCTFVTDLFTVNKRDIKKLPIKNVKRDTTWLIISVVVAFVCLMLRFVWLDWNSLKGLVKLAIAVPLILCAFQIFLAIAMLVSRYKLKDLGIRFNKLMLAGVSALVITAIAAHLVAPQDVTYNRLMQELNGNIVSLVFMGVITAALPEEFMRMIFQTRIGALLNNRALGWYLACLVWAFMHFPKWYGDNGGAMTVKESILSTLQIVPIGLMWSYLIHRTQSIIPSIITHGFNLWGLQNF
jgi:membrane protease YdiL (CAAX protease family)